MGLSGHICTRLAFMMPLESISVPFELTKHFVSCAMKTSRNWHLRVQVCDLFVSVRQHYIITVMEFYC